MKNKASDKPRRSVHRAIAILVIALVVWVYLTVDTAIIGRQTEELALQPQLRADAIALRKRCASAVEREGVHSIGNATTVFYFLRPQDVEGGLEFVGLANYSVDYLWIPAFYDQPVDGYVARVSHDPTVTVREIRSRGKVLADEVVVKAVEGVHLLESWKNSLQSAKLVAIARNKLYARVAFARAGEKIACVGVAPGGVFRRDAYQGNFWVGSVVLYQTRDEMNASRVAGGIKE